MADNLTNAGESAVINAVFGLAALNNTANTYITLLTASPTETGDLTSELAGASGHARVPVASAFATLSSGGSALANDSQVDFSYTAAGGTATYAAIVTGSIIGAGTALWYVALPNERATSAGATISINIGQLVNTMSGALTNTGRSLALNAIFGLATLDNTTNTYIALFTADPTATGDLTNELAGGSGYSRTLASSIFGTLSSGGSALVNSSELSLSFTADVGVVTYFGIVTGSIIGAGTLLWVGELDGIGQASGVGVTINAPISGLSNSIS